LSKAGIEATVVNARFAKPLDAELITDIASRIKHIITVEENVVSGGFGSGVTELLKRVGITVHARSLGIPDEFVEQGDQPVLRARYGLDAAGIAQQVSSLLSGSNATILSPHIK